jgi:hypothetical protein
MDTQSSSAKIGMICRKINVSWKQIGNIAAGDEGDDDVAVCANRFGETNAGRSFVAERSSNGNGTSTTLPRVVEGLAIGGVVEVGFFAQEIAG